MAMIQQNTAQIKDLQRESYFITLERKRKVGTCQKLKTEIEENKRRVKMQRDVANIIKKKVKKNVRKKIH